MNRLSVHTALIGLLLAFAGCHAHFQVPASFGALPAHERYEQRAASPEGVVIALREVEVPQDSSLDFWSAAVERRLTAGEGYALTDQRELRAQSGQTGRLLAFGRDQQGRTYDYWVALFVRDERLYVLEAGGRRDRFEPARAEVEHALQSLTLP